MRVPSPAWSEVDDEHPGHATGLIPLMLSCPPRQVPCCLLTGLGPGAYAEGPVWGHQIYVSPS